MYKCKHICLWFFLNGPFGYQCKYNKTELKKTKCQNNNDDGTMETPSNPIAIYQQSWLAFRISNNSKNTNAKKHTHTQSERKSHSYEAREKKICELQKRRKRRTCDSAEQIQWETYISKQIEKSYELADFQNRFAFNLFFFNFLYFSPPPLPPSPLLPLLSLSSRVNQETNVLHTVRAQRVIFLCGMFHLVVS